MTDPTKPEPGGSICDGIESSRIIYWHCRRCNRRRRTMEHDRYDSFILVCSQGHTFVSSDKGMHFSGTFTPPFRKAAR